MAYNLGQLIVFSVKFLDAAGADVDPTTVEFWLREEVDGTELHWILTPPATVVQTPAGMNAITRDSAGDFHVNFIARKPERITVHWIGSTAVTVRPAQDVVYVRHSGIVAIDHP